MGTQEILRAYRLRKGYTQGQFAKVLNIHRNTVANYESGRTEVPEMVKRRFEVLGENKERTDKVSVLEHDIKSDLILLQRDKILNLEKENSKLKESLNDKTPESSHWDDLKFHYKTEVELHWTSFGVLGRTIWSVSNLKEQSKIFGYSESKLKALWDVGTKYADMSQHPIDGILHQDTKDELQDIAKTLPAVFKAIKDMIGSHYIPTKLMYKRKDGTFVGAIAYNKIDWKTQKVFSKVAFLIED